VPDEPLRRLEEPLGAHWSAETNLGDVMTHWSTLLGLALAAISNFAACTPTTTRTSATGSTHRERGERAEAEERGEATQLLAAWNAIALRTTAAGPFSPPRETRAIAIVSGAVFDAVNLITRRYDPWVVRADARHDASVDAAVSAAARRVLVTLYPASAPNVNSAYDSLMARVPNGDAKDGGIAVGLEAADAALAARVGDRSADTAAYTAGKGNGVWNPTPTAFAVALEPGWGKVKPFYLDSGSQLRPGPPPAPGSPAYERDLLEVRAIGHATSEARTAAQAEAARFWMSTAPQLWNQVARQLATTSDMDVTTAARLYMVMNIAGADAMIAAWDAKYAYNQWRPISAIHGASADGGAAWAPLLLTPPFPDYPAGHTAYGGAAEEVLRALTGDSSPELVISSPTAGGATHRYRTFAEIAEEVVNARVWAGVHWRTSSVVGRELGKRVGQVALARAPRPVNR
jgi:hypothetical protein